VGGGGCRVELVDRGHLPLPFFPFASFFFLPYVTPTRANYKKRSAKERTKVKLILSPNAQPLRYFLCFFALLVARSLLPLSPLPFSSSSVVLRFTSFQLRDRTVLISPRISPLLARKRWELFLRFNFSSAEIRWLLLAAFLLLLVEAPLL